MWRDLDAEIAAEFQELTTRETAVRAALTLQRSRANERRRVRKLDGPGHATDRARKRKLRIERLRARAPIACANPRCMAAFVPMRGDCRFCTHACLRRDISRRHRQAERMAVRAAARDCVICRKMFSLPRANARCCSAHCKRRLATAKTRAWLDARRARR
jgi:hypothetical protein